MLKKFIYSLIIVLCLGYSIFSTVNWTRTHFQLRRTEQTLEQCRTELGCVRAELDRAANQQQLIAERLDRCTELSERTGELLGSSISTVAELRATLREIRANEEAMEAELHYLRQYIGTDDSSVGDADANTGE